ncbi:MFS transporter [Pendulispora brunnea]|uniref:MFS transporter n=1 Tax=Pendulispora brunnea TaxID=2905690 RepID=A0ABZ2K1H3_9BACT
MWRRIFPDWRGLPRAFWLVCAGTFVNKFGTFVLPFLSIYLTQRREFSPQEAGIVASFFGIGSLVAGPLGGVLADRIGRRRTIIASLGFSAIAVMLLPLARTLPHFATGAFVLGMTGDMYRPAVSALVADVVSPDARPRAYAFLYWAVNLGVACGVPLAGALATFSPRWLFLADGATSLLFVAIIWAGVRETRPAERAGEVEARVSSPTILRDTLFLGFVLLIFPMAFVFDQHLTNLPIDMTDHGLNARQYGLLIAINPALIVVLQPTMGQVARGFNRLGVLAFGALLIAIGFGINAFASTIPIYAISVVIWTFGEMFALPVATALVSDLAPGPARGNYLGIYQSAWGAANMTAPACGAFLLQRYGGSMLWSACFLLCAGAAGGLYALASPMKRRLGQDESIGQSLRASPPAAEACAEAPASRV